MNNTGGYSIKDFTAEFRPLPSFYDYNETIYEPWERLDPHHISPNAVSFCENPKKNYLYQLIFCQIHGIV